jgi:hypothetical protein
MTPLRAPKIDGSNLGAHKLLETDIGDAGYRVAVETSSLGITNNDPSRSA